MVSRGYQIDNEALREIRDNLQESKKIQSHYTIINKILRYPELQKLALDLYKELEKDYLTGGLLMKRHWNLKAN